MKENFWQRQLTTPSTCINAFHKSGKTLSGQGLNECVDEHTASIEMVAKTPCTSTGPENKTLQKKADCSETTSQIHHSTLPFELPPQRQKGDRERQASTEGKEGPLRSSPAQTLGEACSELASC